MNASLELLYKLKSAEEVIEQLKNSTDEELAIFSKLVPKAIKQSIKIYWDWKLAEKIRDEERNKIEVLSIVLYATSNLTEVKKAGWLAIPKIEIIKNICEIFEPSWIDSWANWVLEENPRQFTLIYPLVKEGYCNKPTTDNYVLGIIESINYERKTDQVLVDSIRLSLRDLEDDIWRIFEVEGGGEFSLAAHDKYSHGQNCWDNSLRILSEEGTLSRDRLLDSSLKALGNDFAQFRASWFSRLFISLKPTLEELEVRASNLILLMGSQIPPTVSFALKNLNSLEKKKLLNTDMFLDNVEPVLNAKTKSTVMLSLRILESLAKRNIDKAEKIALASTHAIIFDNAEVQKKVFDLIDKYGNQKDENISEALKLNADFIVPSLKNRLSSWVSIEDARSSDIEESYNSTLVETSNNQNEGIVPIENFEELISEFLQLIEEPNDPIAIERLFDGLSRVGRSRPEDFMKLIGPLEKRASTLESRGSEKWLTYQLSKLALSYINNKNGFRVTYNEILKKNESNFENVFIARLYFLVESILRKTNIEVPLISAPTHGRGFITPSVLLDRIKAIESAKEQSSMIDNVLAILRLDCGLIDESELKETIKQLKGIKTEFSLACAYALGGEVDIGKRAALWIAASRIRAPEGEDKLILDKFGTLGPDAGQASRYKPWVEVHNSNDGDYTWYNLKVERTPRAPEEIPLEHLAVLFHKYTEGYYSDTYFGYNEGLVRWGSTIWPGNLEPYFACGACELSISYPEAQWHVQSFFLPMLEQNVPLKPMALLLLIAGLSSAEPGQKGIAIDIVVMSIDDGRMDIALLGDLMAEFVATGLIIVSRWTKAIKEIASISSRHAEAMRSLIQSLLRFNPENSPRELGGLIELLYELSIAADKCLEDEKAIEFFKNNKKGGKQGKFAKKLLQAVNL